MITAEQRGQEMMLIKLGNIPPVALKFAEKLWKELGFCGEVLLTAWTVYAQCVEKLPCNDDLYKARPQDYLWFEQNINTTYDDIKHIFKK